MNQLVEVIKEIYEVAGKQFLDEAFRPQNFSKYFKNSDGTLHNLALFEPNAMPEAPEGQDPNQMSQPGQPVRKGNNIFLTGHDGKTQVIGGEKYLQYLNYFKSLPADDQSGSKETATSGSQTDPTQVDYSQQNFDPEDPHQKMFLEQEAEFMQMELERTLKRDLDAKEKSMVRQAMGLGIRGPLWQVVFDGYALRMGEDSNPIIADQLEFAKDILDQVGKATNLANDLLLGVKKSKDLTETELDSIRAFTIRTSNSGGLYLRSGLAAEIAGELGVAAGERYGLRVLTHGAESSETIKSIADMEGPDGLPLIPMAESNKSKEKAYKAIAGVMFEHATDIHAALQARDANSLLKTLKKIAGKKEVEDLIALVQANQLEKIETIDAMGDGYMRLINEAAEMQGVETATASETLAYLVATIVQRSQSFVNALPEGAKVKQSGQAGAGIMPDGTILNADAVIKGSPDVAASLKSKGVSVNPEEDIAVSMKYLHDMKGNIDLGMRDGRKMLARPIAVKMAQAEQAEKLANMAKKIAYEDNQSIVQKTMQALEKEATSITRQMQMFERIGLGEAKAMIRSKMADATFEDRKRISALLDAITEFKKSGLEDRKEKSGKLETILTNNYRATLSKEEQRVIIANHFMTAGMSTDPNQIMLISTPDKKNLAMNEEDLTQVPLGILTGEYKLSFKKSQCNIIDSSGNTIGYVSYRYKDGRPKQGSGMAKSWFQTAAATL